MSVHQSQKIPFVPPRSIPITAGPELRSGVQTIVGFIPAGVLIPYNYLIPTYDPRTGDGYQRPSQDNRVNELATDLKKGRIDLPTAILLNLRNKNARNSLNHDKLELDRVGHRISNKLLFHVVDGQHRILALHKLIEEDSAKWSNFRIPFVCMMGATEGQEMEQFYVVNSRAKPVRTDLALALLKKLVDADQKFLERLEEKGKDWQIAAENLIEALSKQKGVWRGLIRLAAMDKGTTTMPSASMATSLKPLLTSSFFGRLAFDQQLRVLDAYWRGVREVMRPAFDDPSEFVIQKGIGVIVMHAILVDLLELIRSTGMSVVEPQSFANLLKRPIEKLEGEAQDGHGTPVVGIDFWRIAPKGAAGSYSSSAGRRVLIAKLRQMLPHVKAS